MGASQRNRKAVLGKPKYYIRARTRQLMPPPDVPANEPLSGDGWFDPKFDKEGRWWVKFFIGTEEVALLIPRGGDPSEAQREWFVRIASGNPAAFDVASLIPIWNYGTGPRMKKRECGEIHLEGTRSGGWGPEILEAHQIYFMSGFQGINPYHLAAILEPDRRLPFFDSTGADPIPWKARWIAVPVDLAQPIEPQLRELMEPILRIRDYVHLLAGKPTSRPSRYQTARDVLAFTLKYSVGRAVPQIAKELFPKERQDSAEEKVKGILKRIRRILKEKGVT